MHWLTNLTFLRIAKLALFTVIILGSISCSYIERRRNPNLDIEIYSSVTISNSWFEINPQKPLKAERQVNQVILWFAEHQKTSLKGGGIIRQDGVAFIPEVELLDEQGNIYKLDISGLDETGIAYSWRGQNNGPHRVSLPSERLFVKVRIKSSHPINISSIVWRNYNPQDFK